MVTSTVNIVLSPASLMSEEISVLAIREIFLAFMLVFCLSTMFMQPLNFLSPILP